jgi:hypothetical protein
MSEYTYPQQLVRWGGTALAAGAGARIVKHLLDISRDNDIRTPISGKRLRSNVTQVPVEVTPEEAEQLKLQGVKVKTAVDVTPPGLLDGSFMQNIGLGALGTAALAGGWKGVDAIVDNSRKAKARAELERQRRRVEKLLDSVPDPMDAKIAGILAAGEDHYIKTAGIGDVIAQPLNAVGILGVPLGVAGVLGLAASYAAARKNTESEQKLKQLKEQHTTALEPEAPLLSLQPVVRANLPAKV